MALLNGPQQPGTRLPFDPGFSGETRPGTVLLFDPNFGGQVRPGVQLPFDEGGSNIDIAQGLLRNILLPAPEEEKGLPSISGGVFELISSDKPTAIQGLKFKRTGGTPGSLTGVNEAAALIAKLFEGKRPSAIGPEFDLDEIKELLFEQVAEERRQAIFDEESDRNRRLRHGLE